MSKYVNLPQIESIEIQNFDLYKNGTFKWNFSDRFNLFLGINGLGKTTTLKLIAYGLVGLINENSNIKNISKVEIKEFTEIKEYGVKQKGYFKRYKNQINSSVYLEFKMGIYSFKVRRDILKHKIVELIINDNKIENNLDESYCRYFEKYSGMTIDNFINILYTLLIRFEEAPSLLFRPRIQHTALRTLIFESSFHKDFIEAERQYRVCESKYRYEKHELIKIKRKINELEKKLHDIDIKLQDNDKKKNNNNLSNIDNNLKILEKEISNIDKEIEYHKHSIDQTIYEKENLIIENEKLENQLDELLNKILTLQEQYYLSIYGHYEIYNLAINSLNSRNNCIFCNNTVNESKKEVLEKSINQGICPFCENKVSDSEVNPINIDKLNKLNNGKKNIQKYKIKIENKITEKNKQISIISKLLKELYDKRNILIRKYEQNYNLLIDQKYEKNKTLSNEILLVKKDQENLEIELKVLKDNFQNKSKEIFGIEIDYKVFEQGYSNNGKGFGLEYDFYLAEKKYQDLKEKSRENIALLEQSIIKKFEKYNILNNQFKLIQEESKNLESNIDVKYNIFIPVSIEDNNVRTDETKLSKSEQIMLDYAFRLALIDLYSELSDNHKIFVAFESSEGVFDIGNIDMFTKMLKKYSKDNMLLLISNFNNIEYLNSLISNTFENDTNKILNFISISGKENIDKELYNKLWNSLVNKGDK